MPASDTLCERIAAFACGVKASRVPAEVRQRARLQMASVLGAIFASRHDPGSRKIVRWAQSSSDGSSAAQILGTTERTTRHAAMMANAAASCTFDFDDYQLVGHTGHSAALAPIVWGEALDASWEDCEEAQIAAAEVGGRFGLSCFIGPQNGQHLPFVHHAAAAIAVARMLRLDIEKTAHALALALAQPESALWPAFLGPFDGKVLTAATAAVRGATSAELAGEGLTGALDILDHAKGFFQRFAFIPAPAAFARMGNAWTLSTLQIKEHPACAYFQTAVDAASEIAVAAAKQLGRPLTERDIAGIEIETTFLGLAVEAHATEDRSSHPGGPVRANDINFSLALTVALTLLDADLTPALLGEQHLIDRSAALRALQAITNVRHDWNLSRKLLVEVGSAVGARSLLAGTSVRELARALLEARRTFPRLPLDVASVPKICADIVRLLATPRAREAMGRSLEGVGLPFANRVRVSLTRGQLLESEHFYPRGAPGRPAAEAIEVTRRKLETNAAVALGESQAAALVCAVLTPKQGQSVREVVALATPS